MGTDKSVSNQIRKSSFSGAELAISTVRLAYAAKLDNFAAAKSQRKGTVNGLSFLFSATCESLSHLWLANEPPVEQQWARSQGEQQREKAVILFLSIFPRRIFAAFPRALLLLNPSPAFVL